MHSPGWSQPVGLVVPSSASPQSATRALSKFWACAVSTTNGTLKITSAANTSITIPMIIARLAQLLEKCIPDIMLLA